MKARATLPDRLNATAEGLGEASQTGIDQRAAELAQMDGRDVFTDEDIARAAAELGAARNDEEAATCDESADDQGKRTKRARIENDSSLGASLMQHGMAEADHDQRLASSEDDSDL